MTNHSEKELLSNGECSDGKFHAYKDKLDRKNTRL